MNKAPSSGNLYESDELLSQYLLFHYGNREEVLSWKSGPVEGLDFPIRTVNALLDKTRLPHVSQALDLGCAVGRSTFELARYCQQVTGIDLSHTFIQAANTLLQQGSLQFAFPVEGKITQKTTISRPPDITPDSIRFQTGDACNLSLDLPVYDVVHMANLLDRLPSPRHCLNRLPNLVKPGGQLLLTSPFTWLEQFTPEEKWLGGIYRNGSPVTTQDALQEILSPAFELDFTTDLPFVIREHARKYQWSVASASRWVRRSQE